MLNFCKQFLSGIGRKRADSVSNTLSMKYSAYRSLITHNTASLNTLSSLEMLLRDNKPFTVEDFVSDTESLIRSIEKIVESLNALCAGKYQELFQTVDGIAGGVLGELKRTRTFDNTDLVLPLEGLSRDRLQDVGGKAANFGEIHNRVNLPVPRAFAVTAYAYRYFLEQSGLLDTITGKIRGIRIDDTQHLEEVSREIRSLIMETTPPPDLERAILDAAGDLEAALGPGLRVSVRSSATSEDSEASFAGQYSSVLNVGCQGIIEAYKEVAASTYTPRAIFYRRTKGYSEEDVIMSVLCPAMVDAVTSGVVYTVDPTDHTIDDVIVTAAWGLGVSVVDGSTAVDIYRVDKRSREIKSRETPVKPHRVVMAQSEGLITEEVPRDRREAACLRDEEISRLVDYGMRLEEHYGVALDIEWAMDRDGRLLILQARPLNPMAREDALEPAEHSEVEDDTGMYPLLLCGGHCASPGVASGPAHVLLNDTDLSDVPNGCILIAPQTSVSFVSIMGRLNGIVTDFGSVTGHMAAVAREFELPNLVATDMATRTIPNGEEITLDATRRVIYRGRVESLLRRKKKNHPMAGGPVYALARDAMDKIAPLTLTDPHADNFRPKGCATLHDIIRLAHEISMREMFRIGEYIEGEEGNAVRLRVHLPMILYCVDLGGGLRLATGKNMAGMDDLTSIPFAALLRGMTHPGINWIGAVGMSASGLASLMAHSLLNDPTTEGRFGGPNYAVISKEYLNFNARLGYHFAVVDAYCGPSSSENYITFSFKGGAADMERKGRRAKLIAVILQRFGMSVERKGDMIRGELKEGKAEQFDEKLDQLGRLLGAMRLLDMAITDDSQIPWYADEFFKGNYGFVRA